MKINIKTILKSDGTVITLFVVINQDEICVFCYQEFRHIYTLSVPGITCFDMSQNGSVLVTGSNTGEVKIWKISHDGDKTLIELAHTLNDHKESVSSIIFNKENIQISDRENLSLFCCSTARSAILYNLSLEKKYEFIREFSLPCEPFKSQTDITSLAFSKCGLMLKIGTNKNRVIIFLLFSTFKKKSDPTEQPEQPQKKEMEPYTSSSLSQHSGFIKCMNIGTNGSLLVGSGSTVTIWKEIPKPETEKRREYGYRSISQTLKVKGGCVSEIVSHSIFDMICVSDGFNGNVNIYSISPDSPPDSLYELKFSLKNCFAEGIAFHPTEPILAIYINVFDMKTHKVTRKVHFYRLSDNCAILTLILMISL